MRLDRSLSLSLFSPLLNVRFGTRPHYLPILMYHSISDSPETGIAPYYKLCTSPTRFAEQMQSLADLGYRGVTLTEGLRLLDEGSHGMKDLRPETGFQMTEGGGQRAEGRGQDWRAADKASGTENRPPLSRELSLSNPEASARDPRPPPLLRGETSAASKSLVPGPRSYGAAVPVAITFDDGYADFDSTAYPILQEHGFAATVYLPTAFISNHRKSFKSQPCMTWTEVRELSALGIEFGSHTVTHPTLYKLPWSAIDQELAQSKDSIEQAVGTNVYSFAYPYAFPQADAEFVLQFCHLLVRNDYRYNVTTAVGRVTRGDNPFLIKRLPINQDDDQSLVAAKLHGAYDWLAVPQAIAKLVRHAFGFGRARATFEPV